MQTDFVPRVLRVDDDTLILETLSVILETSGVICATAEDGLEALLSLLQGQFDIMITDLKMPKMTGIELLKLVKRRFPRLATIVVSAQPKTQGQRRKLPADAYFQKGRFAHTQLIATIRDLLEQHKRCPQRTPPQLAARRIVGVETQAQSPSPRTKTHPNTTGKENALRFTIQDENFAGFRVRGLYDPEEQAWRVKTWPAGRVEPEHDYWVQDGDLYTARVTAIARDQYWRRSGIGARDITVAPAERREILHLISRWELSNRGPGEPIGVDPSTG